MKNNTKKLSNSFANTKKKVLSVGIVGLMIVLLFVPARLSAQTVKLPIVNQTMSLTAFFKFIENNSGYAIVHTDEINDCLQQQVQVQTKDEPIASLLNRVLNATPLTYSITNRQITVFRKSNALASVTTDHSLKSVTGVVLDSNHQPVIGASVAELGTTNGTMTDLNGKFHIKLKASGTMQVTCVGFMKKQIKAASLKESVTVVLQNNDNLLNAVVVTALGIKREEKALSYNVGKIDTKELTAVKDANFINSLNGKVAGLVVNSTGNPGGATKVILRGAKSLSKDNNALYVIDGVPIINTTASKAEGAAYANSTSDEGIADLNPEDIENITVLTGPSAAALYGSYAANGAILITTKRGSSGKPKVNISYSSEFTRPFVMPKFQNTYSNKPGEFASWGDRMSTPTDFDPENYFQTGYNSTATGSVSFGTPKSQTFVSLGSTNAAGIIPNNKYNRYNFTARNTSKLCNDKLTVDIGGQFIIQNYQNMMSQGLYFNPLVPTYLFPRGENFNNTRMYERYDETRSIMAQWWPYGDLGLEMQNPYWINNRNLGHSKKNRYMINASLKYQVTKWLDVTGRVRVDNSNNAHDSERYATTLGNLAHSKGYYGVSKSEDKQTYADLLANIDKRFGDFSLTANIGTSIFDTRSDLVGLEGQLSQIPNFFVANNVDLNAENSRIRQEGWHEQTQSVFANAELGYKSMVYLTLTGRNDWASALANTPNSSFFYPSVGVSALISQMVKLPSWFTFMKVRGSFSSVGSAPQRYLTVPTYPYSPDSHGALPSTISSGDIMTLKPEKTKSYEVGADFRFFNSKLSLSGTFYKSDTYNQTFDIQRSASSGYPDLYIQSGDIGNWGIEASLGYHDTFGKVHWESQFTFSMNRNKIKALAQNYYDPLTDTYGSINELVAGSEGKYREYLHVGGSLGDMYTAGVLKKDANGNIYIDPKTGKMAIENLTQDKFQKIGNSTPRANMGFRNSFSYAGFNLGFTFTARLGGQVVSETQALMDAYGVSQASADARNNGGVLVNNQRMDAQSYYQFIGGKEALIDHYVYSATNIRLQELTFGYTLPKKLLGPFDVTVSFVGRNLFMIYNKAPFDPEAIATTSNTYQGIDYFMQPSLRSLGFSVRVKF